MDNTKKAEAPTPKLPQPTVVDIKFQRWIECLWATCPTDMALRDFYQEFREPLLAMYTSQKKDEVGEAPASPQH